MGLLPAVCFALNMPGMWPAFDPWQSALALMEVPAAARASAQALQTLRERRLRALLAHALHASPLYRDWMKGADPQRLRLQDLPVVRKPQLMAEFDRWVTDPQVRLAELREFVRDPGRIADAYLGRYAVWESSGSSGEPGLFVQDAGALAVYDALEATRRPVLTPAGSWGERVAFVGATSGHFASIVSMERVRRLNPMLQPWLRAVSILQPTQALIGQLHDFMPTVLATYPTAAVLLAEEQRAGRLRLRLRQVWTGGETLTPGMRGLVERAFGCRVLDSYGASECLCIAAECGHGGLHLNSDWVMLESVDGHGRPVPPGEAGAMTLLTNLANRVQPLIRYALGDHVRMPERACACGSALPLLEVQGRCDDSLCLDGDAGLPVRVLPLALATVLEDEAGLFDFQVVQRGPAELQLSTGLHGAAGQAALQRACEVLGAYLARMGARRVRLQARCGAPAEPGRSGKRRRVIGLPEPLPGRTRRAVPLR